MDTNEKILTKVTKGKAFVLCLSSVMVIFIAMFVLAIIKNELAIIPVSSCLTGVGSLAGIYIGCSVANNGVKGKCWNKELYDAENRGRS